MIDNEEEQAPPQPTKPMIVTLGDYIQYKWIIGAVFATSISHFSGNSLFLNVVHFFTSWFYVVYKFAELFFKSST